MSGGADSTALLLGLWRLARSRGDLLAVAHLDHGLRGAASRQDAVAVTRLAETLGLPCFARRCDAAAIARRQTWSGQDGLRRVRRAFLARIARAFEADAIATAHTADDQLETLLLRLGRGTGLAGLAGMAPRRGRWIKPLLACSRADLEADLREAGIAWREDASNASRDYARNRVRHDVIPALARALHPEADPSATRRGLALRAARAAESARSASRSLAALAGRALGTLPRSSNVMSVPVSLLRRMTPAVRTAAWARIQRAWAPAGPAWTRAHLEALEALARGRSVGPVTLPGRRFAIRLGDAIQWGVGSIEGRGKTVHRRQNLPLEVPGRVGRRGLRVTAHWIGASEARRRLPETPSGVQYFAASGLRGGLCVRTASEEETFVPFGRRRPVRLGSFLKKQHQQPAPQRRHPTVLADASGILWVIGVRRSARAPLGPSTRKVLRVHAERHD